MRKNSFTILIILLLLSCSTQNNNKARSENLLRKEAVNLAINYAREKFKEANETREKNGIITITDNQADYVTTGNNRIKYVIDPAVVAVGLIDDDAIEDAIVTISPSKGQYLEPPENLILINTDGKLMLSRVIESDMKILGIKNRVITAEILTKSRNSPLRDCDACKEVVKFQFRMGDLIRME